jgi:LemA protein
MKKNRFSGIVALLLILLQPALIITIAVKTAFHFFWTVVGSRFGRDKDGFSKFARSVVLMGLIMIFLFGVHTYNKLSDTEHFLNVAHGRLLVEMQRHQVLLSRCQNAVAMYATMEEKIQDRLIALHRLTKTRGPRAKIVESEGLEIMKLVRELDLLIEKYPGLKSKGPYVLLMETIQETEFKVTAERLNYNNVTYTYNMVCLLFPNKILARVLGYREQPFLQGPLNYASLNDSLLLKEN